MIWAAALIVSVMGALCLNALDQMAHDVLKAERTIASQRVTIADQQEQLNAAGQAIIDRDGWQYDWHIGDGKLIVELTQLAE